MTSRASASLTLFALLALCGCAIPGIRWADTAIPGPPLVTGEPTRQAQRCDIARGPSPWASTGGFPHCDIAFRSASGAHVDALKLREQISGALPRALPLRPHLEQFSDEYRGRLFKVREQRYALYLVAVQPAVVVGVPAQNPESSCTAVGWTKCFYAVEAHQTYRPYGSFSVYYTVRPPVRSGSFVWVPDWQSDSVSLPSESATFALTNGSFTIHLVQRGGVWQVDGQRP